MGLRVPGTRVDAAGALALFEREATAARDDLTEIQSKRRALLDRNDAAGYIAAAESEDAARARLTRKDMGLESSAGMAPGWTTSKSPRTSRTTSTG